MSKCSKCKKKFEETELMWVKIKEKMVLLCDFCKSVFLELFKNGDKILT